MAVPLHSKLLKIAYQEDTLFAWFLVDPKQELIKATYFEIYGTGHEIPNHMDGYYVDTVFSPDGFVWHIFKY